MGGRNKTFPDRQEAILRAAAACFARRGFHQSSMKEICEEAGMSPGSVYRYFAAKDDIVVGMIEADRRRWEAALRALPADEDLMVSLRRLADLGLADVEAHGFLHLWVETSAEASRNPKVARVLQQSYHLFEGLLAERVERAQAQGRVRRSLSPLAAARMILSTFDGLLLRRSFDDGLPVRESTAEFLAFLGRALGTHETGREPEGVA